VSYYRGFVWFVVFASSFIAGLVLVWIFYSGKIALVVLASVYGFELFLWSAAVLWLWRLEARGRREKLPVFPQAKAVRR
jgi:hypothetical protein